MLDKIEILNATVESHKERSKSNTDHHQRDSHELNQQLLSMKKMLLETESDVQGTLRTRWERRVWEAFLRKIRCLYQAKFFTLVP